MALRWYQDAEIQAVIDGANRSLRRMLIVAATGTGKTVFFANLTKRLKAAGIMKAEDKTLVLVHREELADQAKTKIEHWNPSLKVQIEMADSFVEVDADIIVASVQSLYSMEFRRLVALLEKHRISLIITDEAHHYVSEKYMEVVTRLLAAHEQSILVGVTATANRGDGAALGQLFDEIVFQYTLRQAIKEGYLADIKGLRLRTKTDLSHLPSGAFAVNPGEGGDLSKAVNTPQRNKEVVDFWLENASTRQTIGFTVDIQHAKDLALEFQKRGIPCEAVWGEDKERKEKLERFSAGITRVLLNPQFLTEGYDEWRIACVLMVRPTKSSLFYQQAVGRGTRIQPGIENLVTARQAGIRLEKEDCLLLDVVDVTGKHSLITAPTLFGMSPSLDLNGKSVIASAEKLEKLQEENPQIDFSKLDSIDNAEKYVEQVDVWDFKWDPIVEDNSQLAWYKTANGSYVLLLPNHEKMMIYQEGLSDKWYVEGTVQGNKIEKTEYDDVPGALLFAEMNIMLHGKGIMTLLKREQKWHKDKADPKQVALLVRFGLAPVHVAKNMTKGAAAKMLSSHFVKKRGSNPQTKITVGNL